MAVASMAVASMGAFTPILRRSMEDSVAVLVADSTDSVVDSATAAGGTADGSAPDGEAGAAAGGYDGYIQCA